MIAIIYTKITLADLHTAYGNTRIVALVAPNMTELHKFSILVMDIPCFVPPHKDS